MVHDLLRVGANRLSVANGHLNRIHAGTGLHTCVVSSETSCVSTGTTRNLAVTYCRHVIAGNAPFGLHNVSAQDWAEDPASDALGLECYLGVKVLVDDHLYGTLCFADTTARSGPFDAGDHAMAVTIGRLIGCLFEQYGSVENAHQVLFSSDQSEAAPSDDVNGSTGTHSTPARPLMGAPAHGWDANDASSADPARDRPLSPAQLETLFAHSPDMVNLHDVDGNILAPNQLLCRKTGYAEEDFAGMKVWDIDPDISPRQAKSMWTRLTPGDRRRFEGRYERADGSTFPVEVHLRCLDLDGAKRFLAMSRDITERQKEAQRRRQVISRVTDAIVEVDADWRVTLVNEQAEALYDTDAAHLIGKHFWDVFSDALGTRFETEYRSVMSTREPTQFVEYHSELEGWFDVQVYPNADGGLAFYFEEVTERKKRVRRMEAVFNHTFQFTGLMTPDGTLIEANDRALEFGGLEEADVLGQPLWETYWVQTGDEDRQKLRAAIRRAADGEFVRYERVIQGADGERVVDFSIRPVTNEAGDVTLLIPEARDITERKQQEQALREERNLLSQIFQTSPTAISVVDADGDIVQMSDQAENTLGITQKEGTTRSYDDPDWHITAPDGGPFPDEDLPFARVKHTGEPVFDVEHAIEWPDGTRRLLSVNGAPLYDDDGTFSGAVFHLDDITDRRRNKRRLRESEQRFRGVFESAALGIALVNPDGTLINANPAFQSMLGYAQQDLEGRHFSEFTHPDHLEDDQALFQELLDREREQYTLEKKYLRQNGESFWGRLTLSRQEGPDGPQIIGLIEDIDQRKQQQEELKLFKKVVEQAYDGVMITDGAPVDSPGPRIRYVNPALCDITGYEAEELVGETPRILQGPDTESSVLDRLQRRLEEGLPFDGEARNYRKDGTPYINHWNIAPVHNEDGERTHWVSVQRDVTEARRTTKQLLELQAEERRHIEQEIHDEMGGLLTSLQMTVELTRMQAEDENIIGHLDDLEDLTDDLASVARALSQRLHPSSLDDYGLSNVFPALIDEFESRHDLAIDFQNEIDTDTRFSSLIETTAYHVLREALWNVVQHAETEQAEVAALHSDGELRLEVRDDGVGFTPEAQLESDLNGLSGIRIRVERLNGEVLISSAPGEGTRLSVVLPLTAAHLS